MKKLITILLLTVSLYGYSQVDSVSVFHPYSKKLILTFKPAKLSEVHEVLNKLDKIHKTEDYYLKFYKDGKINIFRFFVVRPKEEINKHMSI